MDRILLLIAMLISFQTPAVALEIDPDYYIYPVEDVAQLYSANFGELRPDHFHSGIDIKTDQVEGKRVVAVADGYVSRLGVSPTGYGLAIYVAHPNGTTSVYGHLSKFRPDIESRVQSERYASKQHSITLYFKPGEFPVKRGDLIAYSGNSGSSSGPHVHYEIRESATQKPINVIKKGIIKPRDTRHPIFFNLHYFEIDSVGGVAYSAPRKSYTVLNPSTGQYQLNAKGNQIEVGRKGYFVVEVSDRKDDVTNTFGIYSLDAQIDGDPFFRYQMDGFTFDQTRYVNGVSGYAQKIGSRHEVIRLAQQERATSQFYPTIKERGVVRCDSAQIREVAIVITDDCGLESTLRFNIVGKRQPFVAKVDPSLKIAYADKPFGYRNDGLNIYMSDNVLYESIPFRAEKMEPRTLQIDSTVRVVSPIYRVLSDSIPLHKAISISIDVDLPTADQSKATMGKISRTGWCSNAGGTYGGGKVTLSTRSAGEYFVAIDDTPPVVVPNFVEGANLSSSMSLSFDVRDNFSGVSKFNATIDGEWIALDLHKGRITHKFVTPPSGGEHTIKITVSDAKGNSTTLTRKFKR
ncbi:MAG: M23 family metallopeptidase [Rikenellaceae bacterium]